MIRPIALIFLLLSLAGCATSVKQPDPPPAPAPVIIPTVPPDVLACVKEPVKVPDKDIDAGEVERLWKTDRASLAKVNACLHRVVCQYQDVRQEIAGAPSVSCEASAKKAKKKRPAWMSLLRGTVK
jgi:hypothetical protein